MNRLFKDDPDYNFEFYQQGVYSEPLHHSQNKESGLRVMLTAAMIEYLFLQRDIRTVLDLGCGDGGLLRSIYREDKKFMGIDLSKANTEFADDYLFEVRNEDFTKIDIPRSDLIIICETLEHLVDPIETIKRLNCKYLVASTPMDETLERHSPLHLWGFEKGELAKIVEREKYKILNEVFIGNRTQIVIAAKI